MKINCYPLTCADVLAALDYSPEGGTFTWRHRCDAMGRPNTREVGKIAGKMDPKGYRMITLNRKRYLAHRVVWLVETGTWPNHRLDHINGLHDDNRFENLREADHAENLWNRGVQKNSRSGVKGVFWNKQCQRWMAKINVRGVNHYLGTHKTVEAAAAAYQEAASRLHGDFANTI